ncbi:class I SAM-dependent methyltransferase [Candidatus Bathyarchaeota archaeon]|nr:class I SAM-dependent methyltransferase [Candidatus Bathyarchaeota archaeon]
MPWYGSHSYLNEFIRINNCRKIMEIGVYNGENAKRMVLTAIENSPPHKVEYYGFDFFSYYTVERVGRKLDETGCKYKLIEGNTLKTLPEATKILPKMDIIFIDGGKSSREAMNDWEYSEKLMHDKTSVFVHNVDFSGVSRAVDSISRQNYTVEIFYSPSEGTVALIKKKMIPQQKHQN